MKKFDMRCALFTALTLLFSQYTYSLQDQIDPEYGRQSCLGAIRAVTPELVALKTVQNTHRASMWDCDLSTNMPNCSTNPTFLISVSNTSLVLGDVCNTPGPTFPHAISRYCPEGYSLNPTLGKCVLVSVNPDTNKPCPKAANPIALAFANKQQVEVDYRSQGEFPLEVIRYYNSNAQLSYIDDLHGLGSRWRSNYDRSLMLGSGGGTGTVAALRETGSTYRFIQSGGVWSAGEDVPFSLVQTGSNWELKNLVSGIVETYNASGVLLEIRNRSGIKHTLDYDASHDGLLASVTHSDGRVIQFNHSYQVVILNGYTVIKTKNISGFTDPDSNMYSYDYADGNLTAVHYPGSHVRSYFYSGKLLTRIDEDGQPFAAWSYDANGRAVESYHGNSTTKAERVTLSEITADSTTVTNVNGQDTVYHFDNINGQKNLVRVEGQSSGSCAPSDSYITYDENGYRNTVTEGLNPTPGDEGVVTRYVYGDSTRPHLVTEEVHGLKWSSGSVRPWSTSGTFDPNATDTLGASQKVETDWHSAVELPIEKRYWGRTAGAWEKYQTLSYIYDDATHNCDNNSGFSSYRICSVTVSDNLPGATSPRTWSYEYTLDASSKLPTSAVLTDPKSHSTTYTYTNGNLVSVVNAMGQQTAYSGHGNNAFGLPETITDPNNVVTTITYDARGRVDTITADSGGAAAVTNLDYYPNGLLWKTTQPDGSLLEYFYNDAHHLIRVQSGVQNGYCDHIEYGPSLLNGDWETQDVYKDGTLASGVCTGGDLLLQFDRDFDDLGRISALLTEGGGAPRKILGYDGKNNLVTQTLKGDGETIITPHDANDLVMVNTYDVLDRLVATAGLFDCGSNSCLDIRNNYAGSVPGGAAVTSYAYNGQGLVSSVTDAKNHSTFYTYNGFGEIVSEVSPDRGTLSYLYDNAGNLLQKTDGRGKATRYGYDALNRLTAIDYGYTGTFAADISYTYDQNDSAHGAGKARLTRVNDNSGVTDYQYNNLGQVVEKRFDPVGSVGALTTAYQYDAAGSLTQITYPGGRTVAYNRVTNHVQSMDLEFGGSSIADIISGITYQPFGGVSGFTRGMEGANLQTIRSYNPNGTLAWVDTQYDGTSRHQLTYDYDAFDNISHIGNSFDEPASETFVYDPLQRLVQATGLYGRYSYTYDAVGNRLTQMLERAPANDPTAFSEVFTDTYTYANNSNRLNNILRKNADDVTLRNRTLGHDAAGNTTTDSRSESGNSPVTRTLIYGDDNRLQGVDAP